MIIIERLIEIIKAPVNFPEMIWVLAPLVVSILLTEFYFSRYRYEERGWEYFFGNSMILIFVSLNLLSYLYKNGVLNVDIVSTSFSISIGIIGIILLILNFFHILPETLIFGISNNMPINFLAYMAVILVYSGIVVDYTTTFASLIFLIIWSVIMGIIHKLIPRAWSPNISKEEVPEPDK
mgnify:CR=1 FL=1